jgi:DNA primase
MRQEGLDFVEAARSLAREAGVEIPEKPSSESAVPESLRRIHTLAHEFFRETLRSSAGETARAYLAERGTPTDLIERFQIGCAAPQWDALVAFLIRHRERLDLAELAGLVARRQTSTGHYDRFRARLVFPICDPSGRVVGFGGRALGDDKPKYLNSAENPIYRKGRVLFGLNLALGAIRQRQRVVLVEGYFDVVALHRAGIQEVVAPCGTALTREQAQMLGRYAREVVLLFDGDTAGQNAAERALPLLLAEGLRVRAAFLPAAEDPDTLLGRSGPAALRELVERAGPYLDHHIDQRIGMERAHAWQVADRVRDVAECLNAIADPVEFASYVQGIASRLQLDPGTVAEAVRRAAAARPGAPVQSGPAPAAAPAPQGPLELDPAVRTLIQELLAHPQLVEVLYTHEPAFELSWVPDERSRALLSCVLDAVRERAERACAWLLAPGAPVPHVATLAELAATEHERSSAQADEAVRDCICRLADRALLRDAAGLKARLESCTEPGERERLFAELDSVNRRRGRRDRQRRDERSKTRIPNTVS